MEGDPQTLAVAVYDLGEFSRFYPQGKHILKNLDAKSHMMSLMDHEDRCVGP